MFREGWRTPFIFGEAFKKIDRDSQFYREVNKIMDG